MRRSATFFLFSSFVFKISLFYVLLSGIFFVVYYLMTLRFIPHLVLSASVLGKLIPQISLYSFPLALSIGVGLLIDELYLSGEYFMIAALSRLKKAWHTLLIQLGIIGAFFFAGIIGWMAPYYYCQVKTEIAASAVRSLKNMESETLHTLSSSLSLFFRKKEMNGVRVLFKNIILIVPNKQDGHTIMSARKAELFHDILILCDGGIAEQHEKERLVYHQFKRLRLPLAEYYDVATKSNAAKYKVWSALSFFDSEWWRRFIQVLIVFFFPLGMFLLTPQKPTPLRSGLLGSIVLASLFFISLQMSSTCLSTLINMK